MSENKLYDEGFEAGRLHNQERMVELLDDAHFLHNLSRFHNELRYGPTEQERVEAREDAKSVLIKLIRGTQWVNG